MPSFDYKEEISAIFGKIKRPLIKISIYSESAKIWLTLENVLADSGADISILPKDIGENLKMKINGKEFIAPVVIIDSNDVHPILGRVGALDQHAVTFERGERTIIG